VAALDDLKIAIDPSTSREDLAGLLAVATPESVDIAPWVVEEAVDGLKFSECLPAPLAKTVVARRLRDATSVTQALGEGLSAYHAAAGES
jgi:hypothetical protein